MIVFVLSKLQQVSITWNLSKDEGRDQESKQSSTTPDPSTMLESDKNTRNHHTQERKEVSPFPAGDRKDAGKTQNSTTKINLQFEALCIQVKRLLLLKILTLIFVREIYVSTE